LNASLRVLNGTLDVFDTITHEYIILMGSKASINFYRYVPIAFQVGLVSTWNGYPLKKRTIVVAWFASQLIFFAFGMTKRTQSAI